MAFYFIPQVDMAFGKRAKELSQDLDGILQRLLKHLFPELPRHRQIMLKFDASMLDARRCGSTTMADTMLQPAGHQFLKEQALQAVRSLRDRKPIVRIHEIRNLLGYLDPLRARGLMRRTCRRAQFSVADSLSGMVFLASGSRAQGLKCFAQHGHYLLFDSGLKSRSNVSAPWFRGVGVPEGLLGICVNFTLVGCEVQAAWSFLLRRFSQPLETPPPPEAIIRARLCSQTAFEAWAVLQEFLGEDCWKTSLPVLAKRLQSMDLFDPALQTALLNAVSLAQSESSVQLGSPKNLIENRSDF
ncbi:unnamed protein product [Symbiodinium necroappetens]|uniref:Uncharacterized protein n=1 Tax=Symbiodinium necroappetens TaxID=1628268 RepID=A0A812ZDI2_9DINO|nr:unnamed protein product [Symbiodinium necroappetens]